MPASTMPESSIWATMGYVPPRGKCHSGSLMSSCPCLRFMLHPLKVHILTHTSSRASSQETDALKQRPRRRSIVMDATTMRRSMPWRIPRKMPLSSDGRQWNAMPPVRVADGEASGGGSRMESARRAPSTLPTLRSAQPAHPARVRGTDKLTKRVARHDESRPSSKRKRYPDCPNKQINHVNARCDFIVLRLFVLQVRSRI